MYIPNYIALIFTISIFITFLVFLWITRLKKDRLAVFVFFPILFLFVYFVVDKIFFIDLYMAAYSLDKVCVHNSYYDEASIGKLYYSLVVNDPNKKSDYRYFKKISALDVFKREWLSFNNKKISKRYPIVYFKINSIDNKFVWANRSYVNPGVYKYTEIEGVEKIIKMKDECFRSVTNLNCEEENSYLKLIKKPGLIVNIYDEDFYSKGKFYSYLNRTLSNQNGSVIFKYFAAKVDGALIEKLDTAKYALESNGWRRSLSCESSYKENDFLQNFKYLGGVN